MKLPYSEREAGDTQRIQHMAKDLPAVAGDCSRTYRGSETSTATETFLCAVLGGVWGGRLLAKTTLPSYSRINALNKACML